MTPTTPKFQNPRRGDCDLVMKGGITSGVVYPQAVLVLAEEYRFRYIGGGSVGSIAAALTAAAEFDRENGGFERLDNEQEKLRQPGFLLEVFQAPDSTRPLLNTLLDLADVGNVARTAGKSEWRAVLSNLWLVLLRNSPRRFVTGALVGVALGVALIFLIAEGLDSSLGEADLNFAMLAFGLLSGLLFGPLWTAARLAWILLKELPDRNFYGLCIGSGPAGTGEQRLLTDWLSGVLDDLAGLKRKGVKGPLTFRHLRENDMESKKPGESAIALRMMTTNLNQQEPYVFPKQTNTFLFKREDMRRFFPRYVVDYMEEEGEKVARSVDVEPPEGYYFLPQGEDLPVIVPVRMGISFPILLSAVPLYTVKESVWARYDPTRRLDADNDLQPNLFSDGGICSNFPIHFFDSWLPRRPTFGINLTSMPLAERGAGYSTNDVDLSRRSRVPETRIEQIPDPSEPWLPGPSDPDSREWREVGGLVGFFMAIVYSAMNYRDNMQSRLPSYQERTVQIPLSEEEGGLNLGMEVEVIQSIAERGRKAGGELLEGFESARLDHHRWVRLRVLMNQLEEQLEDMTQALDLETVLRLIEEQRSGNFPYPLRDEARCEEAKRLVRTLYALARDWEQGRGAQGINLHPDEPCIFPRVPDEDPQPTLRVTPDV